MKTHLLLSHLENDMSCPLCSLSGVSYDELCFHISTAHPEKQHGTQGLAHFTSSSSCDAGVTESKKPQTASGVSTDSVQLKQNSIHEREFSSPGEAALVTLTTCRLKTTQKSVRHCNANSYGNQSEHDKAKYKRLSSPRKGHSNFQI